MNHHSKSVKAKITALFLVVILLLSLASTSLVYAENEAADNTQTETETEAISYFFEVDGIRYLVTGDSTASVYGIADRSKLESNITPEPGYRYLYRNPGR